MPVYEYQCSRCGHLKEVFQKISESPLEVCPRCNGKLKKIISQSTFHLKGSGWYVTDYANKSNSSTSPAINKENKKTKKESEPAPVKAKESD
jgi:putative FmdB family regulatory protein